MINLNSINMFYGSRKVLDDFNLNLNKGQIVGLVGPNGSGKTTLLRILSGLEMTYKGSALINNTRPSWKSKFFVSYQPDHIPFNDKFSLKEIMNIYDDFFEDFDSERFKKIISDFKLDIKMKLKQMSKGMKDKVQIALTLSRNTDVYLFDEPISGVDPAARKRILNVILENFKEDGLMIISTHMISEIEPMLDRAVFINNGKVILDKAVDEIRNNKNMGIEEYFEEVF